MSSVVLSCRSAAGEEVCRDHLPGASAFPQHIDAEGPEGLDKTRPVIVYSGDIA